MALLTIYFWSVVLALLVSATMINEDEYWQQNAEDSSFLGKKKLLDKQKRAIHLAIWSIIPLQNILFLFWFGGIAFVWHFCPQIEADDFEEEVEPDQENDTP